VLFEFEEGTSKKFYRIEREGTRVLVHWGRIGTAGQRLETAFATEAEATAEYNREVFKRSERGYLRVVDEALPHDLEEAKQRHALAKTAAPLSANPRFVFTHSKKRRFVWLEANGDALLTAEGPLGTETTAAPASEGCGSAAAALRKRDLAMARLLAQGYALAAFGTAEKKLTRPRSTAKKALVHNAALEAHVAEAPYDEARWRVLEDWVLEQDDPRSELIELGASNQRGIMHRRSGGISCSSSGAVAPRSFARSSPQTGGRDSSASARSSCGSAIHRRSSTRS